MNFNEESGKLRIFLEGRIDSNNAPVLEHEADEVLAAHSGMELIIDVSKLEYISSAGLRILMKLQKSAGKQITVENASPEVYDIFDMTGFTKLLDIKKQLREISIDGCEKLGQGGNGAVYRLNEDKIVKVYKPWMDFAAIDKERSFAQTAFINGIPSVIAYDTVKVGDCLGIVFEMLKSDTLGRAFVSHPKNFDEYMDKYVELAKTLHSTRVPDGSFTEIQEIYHDRIDNLSPWCSDEEMSLLHSITDSIPVTDTVIHSDLHPGNIMLQDDELVLIDMPEVTVGPPICDLTSIYRDLIAAPQGEHSGSIEQSTGMPKELCLKVGTEFFKRYKGLTDKAELEDYFQKVGLLFAFNTVLTCGSGSEKATQLAAFIMDKLLRGIVIPNEQAVRYLFSSLN